MSEKVAYEIKQLADGQKCFGSGHWVIVRIVTETILAAPDRAKAEEFVRKLQHQALCK